MAKLWVTGAILLALGAYALTPAVALLRLDRAMRDGDAATLTRMVDFPSVRKGLAREVVEGLPAGAQAPIHRTADTLPPFGFSFASGIADHAMTRRLTPGGLIGLARADAATGASPARVRLAGVWVDGLTQVGVRLHMTGQRQPIRLWLRLEHGEWKLARDLAAAGAVASRSRQRGGQLRQRRGQAERPVRRRRAGGTRRRARPGALIPRRPAPRRPAPRRPAPRRPARMFARCTGG